MNPNRLNKLFKVASRENVPPVPDDFVERVMRQVGPAAAPQALSLFDQLNELFPPLALVAVAAIALAVAVDFAANGSAANFPEQVAQISAQWLLP